MTISSRKAGVRASLALTCVGSALLPLAATPLHAQSTASQGEGRSLGGMSVTSTALGDDVPGRQQASPKAVRSVRDTPQTITVLGKEVMQQQNLISLQEALQTVPGITFGAGEGGSGYGDSITFRGYSANTDITIDGVRDSAQYSRTDNFNIEQIEITNGASSVQNGSGSVGGNINLVTKRPLDHNQAIFQAGLGTDNYYRATADVNYLLTDNIAFRLNAMYHHNDVPGRQVEQNDRWGVAPAITLGMGGPTQLTLEWYHQQDKNIPQYGVPYFASAGYTGALPGVDRTAYYGYKNLDHQRINVDQYNIILDHEFSDKLKLRNLFRYQDLTQDTRADGPEGIFCLPNGLTATGAACTIANTTGAIVSPTGAALPGTIVVAPGTFGPSGGSRGNTRFTRNQLSYNQTDLNSVFNTGFIEHTLDVGFSLSRETYKATTGNSERFANGQTVYSPYTDIYNPNSSNIYTGPVNFILGARNFNRIEDYAVYAFDAMKLSDHFQINAGVRWERNVGNGRTDTYSTVPSTLGALTQTSYHIANSLFSYRVGLVYKPVEAVTAYIAYGNSKTPSQNTVNGSCTATGASTTCNTKPEGAKNYEIGVKAEVLDNLLLTVALFRNERDSYKVASGDPTVPDQTLDGRSRVNGISVGASGNITPNWSVTANYTYLKSKLIRSVSDFCLSHPGFIPAGTTTATCTNSVAVPNPGGGSELTNVPQHSGSVFTTYRFPFGLTLGYGATYQGKFVFNTPTATSSALFYSNDYLIHNATISYDFTKQISLQVNVKNIGDKLYYTRIRGNGSGWATPGDARSAVATLTVKM